MLTDIQGYFRLPLDKHPFSCQECEADLLSIGAVVIFKMAYSAEEIILCPECGERIGFYLWTDSLRAGVKHE